MNARCQDLRHRYPSLAEGGRCVPDELRAHLSGCADCAAWFARSAAEVVAVLRLERREAPDELGRRVARALTEEARVERIVAALRALPRETTPAELEGRVVAALHAGHREDRAIAWLRDGLTPRRAPAQLERRLAAELSRAPRRPGAPPELASRLDRDLRDLEGTIAGRYASRLEPLSAPDGLRARVQETLERVGRQRRVALATLGLLVVSAVALSALSGWRASGERPVAQAPTSVRFESPALDFAVELVSPRSQEFGPLLEAQANAVTFGLLDVLQAAPAGSGSIPDSWMQLAGSKAAGLGQARRPGAVPQSGTDRDQLPMRGAPGTLTDLRSQPFLEKLPDAPFRLMHSGLRRVEVRDPESGVTLELRERVWSDGKGRFAVRWVEGGPADHGLFELMHRGREGFIQRYRDFRVRDLASFLESFRVDELDGAGKVAGRPVVWLEVARHEEPESRYRAAIDPSTGLVLSYEERWGEKGELVARVEYESIDLDPDLDEIELTAGPTEWLEFDPDEVPPEIADHFHRPDYSPRHHQLERAASRKGPFGRSWVEFVYGDGVEQVFFLYAAPHPDDLPPAGPTGPERGDFVRVSRVGAWTLLEGEIRGTPVMALGKVDLDEVLLLVQSAFGG